MFEIVFMNDHHNCETCGSSYASGYIIKKDGEVVVDKTPIAACYDDSDYNQNEAYLEVIQLAGIQIDVSTEYSDCSYEDDDYV
jgi:hypothetical protein